MPGTIVLPKASWHYENIRSVAGALALAACLWGLVYPFAPPPWDLRVALGGSVVAALTVVADVLVANRRLWRYCTLTTTAEGLQLHTGRIITTDVTIRRDAVLSVEVTTGPVLRRLGLARLAVHGIARLPELPAMSETDVRALRADLSRPGPSAEEPHS